MTIPVNPPPQLRIPDALRQDRETFEFIRQMMRIQFQLWTRTGGPDDAVSTIENGELYEPGIQTSNADELIDGVEVDHEFNSLPYELLERVQALEIDAETWLKQDTEERELEENRRYSLLVAGSRPVPKKITACDVVKTRITPTTQTVNTGTLTSGTVSDVQAWQDGNEVNVSEVTGSPGYDVEYTMTNVSGFCEIIVSFYYDGSGTHDCQVQIYDDANTTWRVLLDQTGTQLGHNTRYTILPDDASNYINSSDQVKIRFYHPVNGNASHDLFIDYVAIIGNTT